MPLLRRGARVRRIRRPRHCLLNRPRQAVSRMPHQVPPSLPFTTFDFFSGFPKDCRRADNVEHVLRRDAGSPSDEHGSGRYGGGYGISLRRRRRRWLDLRPEGYVNVQHKVLLSKNC